MATRLGTVLDGDAGVRWRAWQARGAARDRRNAVKMRVLMPADRGRHVICAVVRLA